MSIFALPIHDQLTKASVEALLAGDALAIWLRGFIPLDHCDHVYQQVRTAPLEPLLVHYTREDGSADYHTHANVLRVSVDLQLDQYFDALTERVANAGPEPRSRQAAIASILEGYFCSVAASNQMNSHLCAPYRRPCDVLFEHLDEVCGVEIAELDGRRMKFGTFLLNRGSADFDDPATVPIHVDSVPSALFPSIQAQLGAMVYCRVPEVGGELRVYDHALVPRDAPIPAEVDHACAYRALKPAAGDVILVNSRRPHAVIPGRDDERLANIMFIGSSGEYPLKIWT